MGKTKCWFNEFNRLRWLNITNEFHFHPQPFYILYYIEIKLRIFHNFPHDFHTNFSVIYKWFLLIYHWIFVDRIKTHDSDMEVDDGRMIVFLWWSHFIILLWIVRKKILKCEGRPEKIIFFRTRIFKYY